MGERRGCVAVALAVSEVDEAPLAREEDLAPHRAQFGPELGVALFLPPCDEVLAGVVGDHVPIELGVPLHFAFLILQHLVQLRCAFRLTRGGPVGADHVMEEATAERVAVLMVAKVNKYAAVERVGIVAFSTASHFVKGLEGEFVAPARQDLRGWQDLRGSVCVCVALQMLRIEDKGCLRGSKRRHAGGTGDK
eukprot:2328566-Prymnesium_polylepis.1